MSSKKTIVVFGGTGGQGGSVVQTLLKDPKMMEEWHIKAVTRDVSKPAAKALAENGVEMVTADMEDVESLQKAMTGAYAVFLVTNYWESMNADTEKRQGINVANVAKEVGVQHLIFSSLLNIDKTSGGVFTKVYHFDSKADIEDYIRSIGIPATFFQAGCYMSNFVPSKSFRPSPQPPHAFTLLMPFPTDHQVIPLLYAEGDTGKYVKGILKNRDQVLGKRIYAAEKYYSAEEMVRELEALKPEAGKGAQAVQLPVEAFRDILQKGGMPPHIAEEASQNFEVMDQAGYFGGADLKESQSILDEPLTTWKDFISTFPEFADLK